MEIASVVFEHNFDRAMLDQIDTLRTIRLNLAERMLENMATTADELESRGLVDAVSPEELRTELTRQITTLRDRLQRPDVVYADEISLYVDLIEHDAEI